MELRANGQRARLEIAAGSQVRFDVEAVSPINRVALAQMDFEGDNRFDETKAVDGSKALLEFHHRYAERGTYFPTVRVTDSTSVPGARGMAFRISRAFAW